MVTLPPAPQYSYIDYWGTHVVAFNVDRGHELLSITGNSLVDTQQADEPDDCTWDDVADASQTMADHISHNLYTTPGVELSEIADEPAAPRARSRRPAASSPPHTTRFGTCAASPRCTPRPTRRTPTGPASARTSRTWPWPWPRSVGLPARYVSGYFHPEEDATIGEEITGESHAWVELWTGRWWGYDPTNDCPVGERHVAVGRGRDYADVPPVKGVYAGNAENTMRVVVRMTRTH